MRFTKSHQARPATLKIPGGTLEYTIRQRARVTRRLHMELDDQGGLIVVAPGHWSKRHINATLLENTSRVQRFLADAQQRRLAALQYTNGEKHLYMGEHYPLVITLLEAGKSQVDLADGELRIATQVEQRESIQQQLQNWYRQQALIVFSERLQEIASRAPWAADRTIPLKLRKMKRTWGNCSTVGLIKFNTHLVKAPPELIDSVIAHELCHLEEMNHGREFYRLLELLNPNWHEDRTRLRAEGYIYLFT
jgi:predicted metal-dependent hydrolase